MDGCFVRMSDMGLMRSPSTPAWLVAALTLSLTLAACGGGDGARAPTPGEVRAEVLAAVDRTVEAHSARLAVTLRSSAGEYRMQGRVDLRRGAYRTCLRVTRTPPASLAYLRGKTVWLSGRNGLYDVYVKGLIGKEAGCGPASWLDDHSPTIDLYNTKPGSLPSAGAEIGGEDFLHMALLALTRTREGILSASSSAVQPDAQGAYRVSFDFNRFNRKPPQRDEDNWFLRPLLDLTGSIPITIGVDPRGYVRHLAFVAPSPVKRGRLQGTKVRIDLRLSSLGRSLPVPIVYASAIE